MRTGGSAGHKGNQAGAHGGPPKAQGQAKTGAGSGRRDGRKQGGDDLELTSSRRFGVTDPSACEAGPAKLSTGGPGSGNETPGDLTDPDESFRSSSRTASAASGRRVLPPTIAERCEVVSRRPKYEFDGFFVFDGEDAGSEWGVPEEEGFATPPPRTPTVDHSRRDRKYLEKVAEYRRQERYRVRVFAAEAIDRAVEAGRRAHAARHRAAPGAPGGRTSPRAAEVDVGDVDLPVCPICCSNVATVVAVPCDHCCICRECAARQRVMSVAAAAAERREAEQAIARAEQQERAARSREETIQMALTSGRAEGTLTPGVRESIEADLQDAQARREAAMYVRHVAPTTRCPVCSFRIDATLDVTRVAQLRRAYGSAAPLPDSFTVGFASGWPGRTKAAARAFAQHNRQKHADETGATMPRAGQAPPIASSFGRRG